MRPAFLVALPLIAVMLLVLRAEAVRLRPQPAAAPKRSAAYVTQGRSMDAVHKAYVRWGSADARNRSAAACEAHSVEGWARVLGTSPRAKDVARAIAAGADPAFRRATYLGCLDELG
jgi:hypothetical protein